MTFPRTAPYTPMDEHAECYGSELVLAWELIRARYGSPRCYEPTTGEVWQYMGSTRAAGEAEWRHAFRHRNLPGRLERVNVLVPATAGWRP